MIGERCVLTGWARLDARRALAHHGDPLAGQGTS
jgi:hypothetical protein